MNTYCNFVSDEYSLVNTVVEHIITHVVVMLNDNLGGASADDFLLKVHGLSEYLIKYVGYIVPIDITLK